MNSGTDALIYRETLCLRSCDVNCYQQLRLSCLFTFLQEAAISHTRKLGAGRDKTLDRGLLWVVTLQKVRIRRMPVYDEVLTLQSWPGEMMHLFFPRFWQILDQEGRTLIDASSLWVLMDRNTRKTVFPEEHGIAIPGAAFPGQIPLPGRFRVPETLTGTEESSFTVPFSVTDLNGHMNNTRYYDLAEDLLPDVLRKKALTEIETEYSGEAKYRETLRLRHGCEILRTAGRILPEGPAEGHEKTAWYLSGESDRPVFRMRLLF